MTTDKYKNWLKKALKSINAKMVFSYAVGLLTASIVIGIVYLCDSSEGPKAALTEDEMIEQLTAAGYLIHTEEEWNEMVAPSSGENSENGNEQPSENEEAQDEPEETVRKITITVSPGMTSIDIGKILEREDFIENAYDFTNRVEEKGVANRLQLGTFEVDSSMTMDEIIAVLFS